MKNRTTEVILAAYQRVISLLKSRGLQPKLQKLNNKALQVLQQYMVEEHINFQLVPPGLHRRKAAERGIRTFKNHFIAGLCTTAADFPLTLWDQLLPQALLTLNLLRTSRINSRLLAWSQVHGAFDFNRTPLAPPGTRVLVHEKPTLRGTWSPHAVDGWYLGPTMLHFRCYRVWILETTSERIADTVVWFPTKVSMPKSSSTDAAIAAVRDLTSALLHPSPASPLSPISASQHAALQQLSTIFNEITDQSPAKISTPTTVTTPTVTPGFEPLPMHVPAALPRVPLSPSTAPSVLPASLSRVPNQPQQDPAPPAPAVDSSPEAPTETYKARTTNAGQRRRQRNKAQRAATKQASKKTRRMNPQLLVLPLAQYPIPASRKNATAPKLPLTLSITSVP
jgi:hypothetical protein